MSLTERVNAGIKQAMKDKNEARKRTLRAVKAQLLLIQTSGDAAEMDEAKEIKLIQKMVKERQDSYDVYSEQGREDLASKEKEELDILKEFLPAPCATWARSWASPIKNWRARPMGKPFLPSSKNSSPKLKPRRPMYKLNGFARSSKSVFSRALGRGKHPLERWVR